MPEELKELLEGLAKAAAEGRVHIGKAEDLPPGLIEHLIEQHSETMQIAKIAQELGDSMKPAIVAAAKAFVEMQGLPEEQFLDYVIYGAIANTLKFVTDDDDDEDDDDECDCCHCQAPQNNAKPEAAANTCNDISAVLDELKKVLNPKA
jgi:hypothetical protein